MIASIADPRLRIFAVWEPILPEDTEPPARGVLAKITDARASQFWDPRQTVERAIRQTPGGQGEPQCCRSEGVLWDVALVFGKTARWEDHAPKAEYHDGTIVKVEASLRDAILREIAK